MNGKTIVFDGTPESAGRVAAVQVEARAKAEAAQTAAQALASRLGRMYAASVAAADYRGVAPPARNYRGRISRNAPCPCGCGKKFKRHRSHDS